MRIVFVLGTGRSGTFTIYNILKKLDGIKCFHELLIDKILYIGTLKYHKKIDSNTTFRLLKEYKNELLKNSNDQIVCDVSNALPLVIEELKIMFPTATFIWVQRNGLKVVASFYYKMGDLMYPHSGMAKLYDSLNGINTKLEKIRTIYRPLYSFPTNPNSRFLNICFHWKYYHDILTNSVQKDHIFRFEDMLSGNYRFFNLFNPKLNGSVIRQGLSRPINVHIPKNFALNDEEERCFLKICGLQMELSNYKLTNYNVQY